MPHKYIYKKNKEIKKKRKREQKKEIRKKKKENRKQKRVSRLNSQESSSPTSALAGAATCYQFMYQVHKISIAAIEYYK